MNTDRSLTPPEVNLCYVHMYAHTDRHISMYVGVCVRGGV